MTNAQHAVAAAAAALAVTLASAHAQTTTPQPNNPEPRTPPAGMQVHPAQLIGQRVATLTARRATEPTVVLVPDEHAYIQAIARWTPNTIFPVLIDDGSDAAREHIARFVRGFQAARVLRWAGNDNPTPQQPPRADQIDAALAAAWNATDADSLTNTWNELGWIPPGAVVADPDDPARTAALALAAGRGQHLLWIDRPAGSLNAVLGAQRLAKLKDDITTQLDDRGLTWREVPDNIDFLTLCFNAPAKAPAPHQTPDPRLPKGPLALTDTLARGRHGVPWAWVGLLHGDAPTAAYRAMAALFITTPRNAFLFDGYATDFAPPYSQRAAAEQLRTVGVDVLAVAPPHATADAWRLRARNTLNAQIVFVNASGHDSWFDLLDGRANASDVPELATPAAVLFIHSFSAARPEHPNTIAAHWFGAGAFLYTGSVHEPTLGAFNTPAAAATRLIAGLPWGIATRHDAFPPWKIQTLGDPLYTLTRPPERIAEPALQLPGARDLADAMKDDLRQRRFADALRHLVILGRDEDALRITRAVLAQTNDSYRNADQAARDAHDIAPVAVPLAARADDPQLLAALYAHLDPQRAQQPRYRAMLWQALRPALTGGDVAIEPWGPRAIALLRNHARDETLVADATLIIPALRATAGNDAAAAAVDDFIQRTNDERARERLRRLR